MSEHDEAERILDLWRAPASSTQSFFDRGAVGLFLLRNIRRICVVATLVAAGAFGASLLVTPRYAATAVLMVDPRAAKVTRAGGVIPNIGGDAIAIESIVQAARSEGFMAQLVDELDLTANRSFAQPGKNKEKARLAAADQLAGRLSITRRGTTYVIDVTATTPSADESARIANAAAAKILTDETTLRTGMSATAAREIESRLSALRGRVSRAEEAAAQLKAVLKVTDAGEGSTLLERRISGLNQQIVLASARTAEARAHHDLLRKAGPATIDSLPQSIQSSVLGALRAELTSLSRQSADQSTVLGPRHPEVTRLNAQIADVKRQILAEIGRMMTAARAELQEAEQREQDLSRQLKAAQAESGELGPQIVKLDELEREAKAERGVYEELLNRERELLEVKDLDPSDIRIVSPASPPPRPSPGLPLLAAGSAIFGLLVGFCHAVAREWMRRTLKTSSEAETLGAVQSLGFLPMIAAPKERRSAFEVPDFTPWLSEICAELTPSGDQGHVILVSSARRGEGRSTVAINLAASLSCSGERVLLIEADRAAHIKQPPYGLLDVLSAGEGLGSALVEQPDDGYMLLPYGGRTVENQSMASTLIGSGMLGEALLSLRRRFDVIIIDGPPVLESWNARAIAAQADNTVFVVEWDKTKVSDAKMALDRLQPKRAVMLFNETDVARLRLYDPEQSRQLECVRLAA